MFRAKVNNTMIATSTVKILDIHIPAVTVSFLEKTLGDLFSIDEYITLHIISELINESSSNVYLLTLSSSRDR
jgi:hypothetical protein